MADKFFSLREAEQLIPALEKLLGTAMRSKQAAEKLEGEFQGLKQRVQLLGGVLPDWERAAGLRAQRDTSVQALKEALEQIEASGCLIKDLDMGLIDFPCLLDQREIYLCWKVGEPQIGFWHGTDEGFAGRKPLDRKRLEETDGSSRPN